ICHFVTSSPQGEDFKFALSASLPLEGKVAPKATDEVEKQSLNTPTNNNLSIFKQKNPWLAARDFFVEDTFTWKARDRP
ncbi:MAG: hypothetical protein IJS47_04545, partial [Clostridia bacterium]|nr:hypothetical protein [Clostridia bacterium]